MTQRLFITLEGGGAKGIAHVGALKAIGDAVEADGTPAYQVAGVSGTSAGAVVAGLYAAGFEPEEIADGASPRTIIDFVDGVSCATDLLPPPGWERLNQLRKLERGGMATAIVSLYILGFALAVLGAPVVAASFAGLGAGLIALAASVAIVALTFLYLTRGVASMRRFRDAYGIALARKLRLPDIPEGVTFAMIADQGRAPLKIVATNLSTGAIELFSAATTPDVPVADAVVASGSIPIAFRSWPIARGLPERRKGRYYDGGLLSNLPTWAFDDERAIDRDAWTIGIEVGDGAGVPDLHETLSLFGKLKRFLRTTVFGSSSLNKRNIAKLIEVPLNTDIGVLDLDVSKEEVRALVNEAASTTRTVLENEALLRLAPTLIAEQFARNLESEGFREFAQALRVSVTPIPSSILNSIEMGRYRDLSVQLRYHYGFEDSLDEYLAIPIDGSYLGRSLTEPAIIYDAVDNQGPTFEDTSGRLRWLHKFIHRDIKWIAALPVLYEIELDGARPEKRAFVVTIDGNEWTVSENDTPAENLEEFESALKLMYTQLPDILGLANAEGVRL